MWHDYGYIEEGVSQRFGLARAARLGRYLKPFLPLILVCAVLILAATATDLALPYITKLAIDRHIVVTAREAVITGDSAAADVVKRHPQGFLPSGKPGLYFIKTSALESLPPEDRAVLLDSNLLRPENLYVTDPDRPDVRDLIAKHPGLFRVYPRIAAIAVSDVRKLPAGDVTALRAVDIHGLGRLAMFCVLIMALGWMFECSQGVLIEYIGQKLTHNLRQDLATHLLDQSVAFHDHHTTGRLVSRVTSDVQNLSEMLKNVATTLFQDLFILGGIAIVLFRINPRLAWLTLAMLPPIVVLTIIFSRLARDVFRKLRAKVAEINTTFSETLAGIRIIQAFRRETENRRRFRVLNDENYVLGLRQIKIFAFFMPAVDVLATSTLGIIIWYGGLSVFNDTMTLGSVVAFIGYIRRFYQPIRDLAEKFNILQSAMASLERIFHLLDQEHRLPVNPDPTPVPEGGGRIAFDDVTFSYEAGHPVLQNVSFTVEPGQVLAIVGATGAGKSSIINLLLRFYDIDSGRIAVDGVDVRDLDPVEHRSRIGLVMQDVFLFAGTVAENIAFSRQAVSTAHMAEAARAVQAADFIEALPDGYDQHLGEGGLTLSAGQRQLLSFARALAQDPRILVLDEATSAIDSDTEQRIETALTRLLAGRTSIVIAHRLSTVRRAHRIVVLDHGRILETGTHEELMARKGLYARHLAMQMQMTRYAPAGPGASRDQSQTRPGKPDGDAISS